MLKRIWTGLALVALLAFALYMGGWTFAVLLMAAICLSIYEEYRAFARAGNRPVQWPAWVCIVASIPMFVLTKNTTIILALTCFACFLISVNVIFREKPSIEDLMASALPLFSVLLPGLCILGLLRAPTRLTQTVLILLCFGVPLMGDTLAYFIGSRFGKHSLCPAVSPHKTVEGSIAGMVGSMLFAVLSWYVFGQFEPMPPLWHFILLGLGAGIAGQVGDLFASLIKRHCDIKDFGNLFPGHGGMMDRLDSTYFSAVVVYIYYSWLFTRWVLNG